ncbi:MAG: beta-ketoacyl synthase chain length factor [Sulfurimicrobium sp.]|nr:beta-ketoacyl synthase chain length factor [Sulfurimicrobium sp.]MDP2199500.1 beta-ketoacyl synthase chain length factor [Sulfurimicrobium sp.]
MIDIYLAGIGLCAPGMLDWASGSAVLRGEIPVNSELPKPAAILLPPAERRRSSQATRYALQAGQEAMNQAGLPATQAAVVFASSDGDGENLHHILESLAQPAHEVSPTRFHNSVHNAAAGYWNIATGARTPANSIAAYDDSFAAGLLEAAVQAASEYMPVLLAAFDLPLPAPLHAVRPTAAPFAVALLLMPEPANALARLQISLESSTEASTTMPQPELESLRCGNPAARALPLLQAVASGLARRIVLGWGDNNLVIELSHE